jgi:hypothetical protein
MPEDTFRKLQIVKKRRRRNVEYMMEGVAVMCSESRKLYPLHYC